MSGKRIGLTRVAFGCGALGDLEERIATFRLGQGASAHVPIASRRVPRRDLSGGQLFWIIRHRLVARQAIMGVDEQSDEQASVAIIRLSPVLVAVRPVAFRAHQGWRYLSEPDWPTDLGDGSDGARDSALPPLLAAELDALDLI